jgi:hypothetical protein
VRGTGLDDLLDLGPRSLRILHDLIRPETHDLPAFMLHRGGSASISLDLKSVMIAVNFDDELA